MGKQNIKIYEFEKDHRISGFFAENWGSDFIISRGEMFHGKELPGFMVLDDNKIVGLLTYHLKNGSCEIVSLDSLRERQGIASSLIEKIINKAKQENYKRLWLITTNDNVDAMKFYQKRGFVFKEVYQNAIKKSRKLKPEIPECGFYGIPIRDEVEFEYPL